MKDVTEPSKFHCPDCGRTFTLNEGMAGRKGQCPCGAVFRVPLDADSQPRIFQHGKVSLAAPALPIGSAGQPDTFGPGEIETTPGTHSTHVVRGILRRWYVVLAVFVVVAGAGVPLAWVLLPPKQSANAGIRVAPIIPAILFNDSDSDRVIPMYENFMNTQAMIMTSDPVLQRAADELAQANLTFFEGTSPLADLCQRLHIPAGLTSRLGITPSTTEKPEADKTEKLDPVQALRDALQDGDIRIQPQRRSELITILVDSFNGAEACKIADAIVRAYMAIEGSKSSETEDKQLSILEEERRTLAERIQQQRETIHQMAEEYGTVALTDRQSMMLDRVADLQKELTRVEALRMAQEARHQLLQKTEDPNAAPRQMAERRQQFITADPTVAALTQRVAQLEQELIIAQQSLAPQNPELQKTERILQAFQQRLQAKRQELTDEFGEAVGQETARAALDQVTIAQAQLEEITTQETILQQELEKENLATIALGRKQLDIRKQQEQLALNQNLHDTIRKRIQQLQLEQKRPARISVAYQARATMLPSRRKKLAVAIPFGALCAGLGLAFLLTKADHHLRSQQDIVQRLGVPVLGTVVNPRELRRKQLPRQLVDDIQAIRSNLCLLGRGNMTHTLAISSAGVGEGKTTLAVNLATSVARSGKRVLLIDGDLRKPDVAHSFGLPKHGWGVPDVLLGLCSFEQAVQASSVPCLDVLVCDGRNGEHAVEALSEPKTSAMLQEITKNYDHVIVDTPPVLAGPLALLWARLADAVVLSTMMGRTIYPDIKEASARLAYMNINVLGQVLAKVNFSESYNRYAYYYRPQNGNGSNGRSYKNNRPLLVSITAEDQHTQEQSAPNQSRNVPPEHPTQTMDKPSLDDRA